MRYALNWMAKFYLPIYIDCHFLGNQKSLTLFSASNVKKKLCGYLFLGQHGATVPQITLCKKLPYAVRIKFSSLVLKLLYI